MINKLPPLDDEMRYTPTELAKMLHISTSTLRGYAAAGIIQYSINIANNRRVYTAQQIRNFWKNIICPGNAYTNNIINLPLV